MARTSRPSTMSRRPGLGWLALVLLVAPACGVNRAEERALPPPAALPNLRRASEALQQRIAREREHVEAFGNELDSLRAHEERLYAEIVEAEETYQRLQGDADAAWDDVRAVEQDLATARQQLEQRTADLERAQLEQQSAEGEAAAARAAAGAARAQLPGWREERELAEEQLAAWRLLVRDFGRRWGIPAEAWASLLGPLGLERLVPPAEAEAEPAGEGASGEPPAEGEGSGPSDAGSDSGSDDEASEPPG